MFLVLIGWFWFAKHESYPGKNDSDPPILVIAQSSDFFRSKGKSDSSEAVRHVARLYRG